MKRLFYLARTLRAATWSKSSVFVILLAVGSTVLADTVEEDQQIAILQSASSPQQKDAACARLKRIGGAKSVAALAALLTDDQLSHSARFALESMPLPAAGRALLEAIDKTQGLTRAGLINSLGNRREADAVSALAKLLSDSDATIAASAAVALGKVANPAAITALQAAWPGATEASHTALVDGLLRSANLLVAAGDNAGAFVIFRQVGQPRENESVRTAAYDGLIRAGGDRALNLLIAGIQGEDPASQTAALRLAHELKDPAATKALVALLPKSPTTVQIALLGALSQRGDPAAGPAVQLMMMSPDPAVRFAAITSLATIGEASAVPVLAEAAAGPDEDQKKAARQSLLELRHGNVTGALIGEMASAKPAVQVELVRALAAREETSTVPQLLELARSGAAGPRGAAAEALGLLADGRHVAPLVKLVRDAKTDSARSEVEQALAAVCERVQAKPGFEVEPIVSAMSSGPAEVRMALLPLCKVLIEPRLRAALRSAAADSDLKVRQAALRVLCEARDPELLPDLLTMVRTAPEASFRTLALRGYVRLATEEGSKFSETQRADLLKSVLAAANSIEDKRLILGSLANVAATTALQLVLPFLENTEVQAEATQAATKIAATLRGADTELARSALKKVLEVTNDPTRRQAAESILKQLEAATDFITTWEVAGPYLQEGKDYAALFDIPFAPETAEAAGVTWRALPNGTDPKKPWLLDLLKFLGGEQRAAYVRTRIYAEKAQEARLELGSDDGLKVWLNGKQVHARNRAAALKVGSDKVNVNLSQGWNNLLLKITQNKQGWEFCARLVKPDGSPIEGLRF